MSSWLGGLPQWLPRRRQRTGDVSPSVHKPGHINSGRNVRRRVTSGGSVLRNNDSIVGTDSEINIELPAARSADASFIVPLENPIHELLPAVRPAENEDLGSIPRHLPQAEIDELHERVIAQNLRTANEFESEEWMFD